MNTTTDNSNKAFQLKGSLFTLTVLHLLNTDMHIFAEQLTQLIKQTPKFFYRMPIVFDLQKMAASNDTINWPAMIKCLRENNIIPVGIRGGTIEQQDAAVNAGLAVLPMTKTESAEIKPEAPKVKPTATKSTVVNYQGSKLITHPVRSGQQIYAKNADLIVLAPVSRGAELIADGHIHVYGALRGRALAGVNGNSEARIFCQNLDAELVSIAGHYWVSEDLQTLKQKDNVSIFLESDRLHINAIT